MLTLGCSFLLNMQFCGADPQGTHCIRIRGGSTNSRCCIGVPTAPGLTGDALRVPDTATAHGVYRGKVHARTGTSVVC